MINKGGPDLVAVNVETGAVTLGDAKYSEYLTNANGYPTIDQFDESRLQDWIDEARADIDASDLPQDVKDMAKQNLKDGNVSVAVVGFGTKEGQQRLYQYQDHSLKYTEHVGASQTTMTGYE